MSGCVAGERGKRGNVFGHPLEPLCARWQIIAGCICVRRAAACSFRECQNLHSPPTPPLKLSVNLAESHIVGSIGGPF